MTVSKKKYYLLVLSGLIIFAIICLLYHSWYMRPSIIRKAQIAKLELILENKIAKDSLPISSLKITNFLSNEDLAKSYLSIRDGKVVNEFGDSFVIGISPDLTSPFIHIVPALTAKEQTNPLPPSDSNRLENEGK